MQQVAGKESQSATKHRSVCTQTARTTGQRSTGNLLTCQRNPHDQGRARRYSSESHSFGASKQLRINLNQFPQHQGVLIRRAERTGSYPAKDAQQSSASHRANGRTQNVAGDGGAGRLEGRREKSTPEYPDCTNAKRPLAPQRHLLAMLPRAARQQRQHEAAVSQRQTMSRRPCRRKRCRLGRAQCLGSRDALKQRRIYAIHDEIVERIVPAQQSDLLRK